MAKVVQLRASKAIDVAPDHLPISEARRIVRKLAQDSRRVFVVPHARKRQKKHGISRRQIMICLRKGEITEGPFLNIHGNWQVNVSRLASGEAVTCTVAIDWQRQLIVVTVYPR